MDTNISYNAIQEEKREKLRIAILEIINDYGVSPILISKESGITYQTLYTFINNKRKPTRPIIFALEQFVNKFDKQASSLK